MHIVGFWHSFYFCVSKQPYNLQSSFVGCYLFVTVFLLVVMICFSLCRQINIQKNTNSFMSSWKKEKKNKKKYVMHVSGWFYSFVFIISFSFLLISHSVWLTSISFISPIYSDLQTMMVLIICIHIFLCVQSFFFASVVFQLL